MESPGSNSSQGSSTPRTAPGEDLGSPTPPPAPKKARAAEPRVSALSRPDVARLQRMFHDAVDDAVEAGDGPARGADGGAAAPRGGAAAVSPLVGPQSPVVVPPEDPLLTDRGRDRRSPRRTPPTTARRGASARVADVAAKRSPDPADKKRSPRPRVR
jgi:hypothetical protein